jgi:hypothetical protein
MVHLVLLLSSMMADLKAMIIITNLFRVRELTKPETWVVLLLRSNTPLMGYTIGTVTVLAKTEGGLATPARFSKDIPQKDQRILAQATRHNFYLP